MSKISYRYRTPIPIVFWKNGVLDPSKKMFLKRLAFLTWAFWKCHYDCHAFSCCRESASKESGLTIQEWRTQEQYFIEEGFLKKKSNEIHDRISFYEWDEEKISEDKIISIKKTTSRFTREDDEELTSQTENQPAKQPAEKPAEKIEKQPADLRDEISKINQTNKNEKNQQNNQPINHVYINDKTAINLSLDNSDKEAKPRAREQSSLSFSNKLTAFVNPRTYRLRDGKHLSLRMQNALRKYSPREEERLLANMQFYEQWVDSGKPIKLSHEAFLQSCINNDYALKNENAQRNNLYARFLKEEHQAYGMEILQKTVKIKKSDHEEPISISTELTPSTFEKILENYVNNYYPIQKAEYAY